MKKLHKGEILFRQGERGPLFRLEKGLLKVVRIHEDGTQFIFNIITPEEIFPHHSLITPKEYHGTAIALTACEVTVIPAPDWYAELEQTPEHYRNTALLLQSKLRMMQQRIDQLTAVDPRERLQRFEKWFGTFVSGQPVKELMTQEEIGQFLGLRRETVNRLLRERPV